MRVRPASRSDFEAVAALLAELGRPQVTGPTLADCVAIYEEQVVDPDAHHIVAESDAGEVIGFCSLHFRERLNWPVPEAWVPDLVVAVEDRRGGVGKALLGEVERRARERGCYAIALESGYQRAEAHHLYTSMHFRDWGKYFVKMLKPAGRRS